MNKHSLKFSFVHRTSYSGIKNLTFFVNNKNEVLQIITKLFLKLSHYLHRALCSPEEVKSTRISGFSLNDTRHSEEEVTPREMVWYKNDDIWSLFAVRGNIFGFFLIKRKKVPFKLEDVKAGSANEVWQEIQDKYVCFDKWCGRGEDIKTSKRWVGKTWRLVRIIYLMSCMFSCIDISSHLLSRSEVLLLSTDKERTRSQHGCLKTKHVAEFRSILLYYMDFCQKHKVLMH